MYQRQVTFSEAVNMALKDNYCNFSGRASRSELWWWMLFTLIVGVVVNMVGGIFGTTMYTILNYAVSLAFLLPNLGIQVRRLHDVGRSGWWLLLALTGIGVLVLLYWYVQNSEMRANKYGSIPDMVE